MDISLKRIIPFVFIDLIQVSILVLMDISLKQKEAYFINAGRPGFNPCLNGYFS